MRGCPDCGAELNTHPHFSAWCTGCEWNLEPDRVDTPPSRRRRRADRAVSAIYQQALDGGPAATRLGVAGWLVALPVHALTVGLLGLAGWIAFRPGSILLRAFPVALLLAICWVLRPRLGRVPSGPHVLGPDTAPELFAVLGAVASALGATVPRLVTVTDDFNAGFGRLGPLRRPVLLIGYPLWNVLDGAERLALLGHELGHDVNQDLRRELPLGSALDALAGWESVLHPSAEEIFHDTSWALAEQVAKVLMYLPYLLVRLIGAGAHGVALRSGQAAEYRADLMAVQVAGREATERLLVRLLLAKPAIFALERAVVRAEPDPWAAQRAAIADAPASERDRYERIGRRRLQRVDVSHPPTHYRLDLVRAAVAGAPAIRPDAAIVARIAAADAELARVAPRPCR